MNWRLGAATLFFAGVSACSVSTVSTDTGPTPDGGGPGGGDGAAPQPDGGGGPSQEAGADTAPGQTVPTGMVLVPAGPFSMGCGLTDADKCYSLSRPTHTVTVSAFAIDTNEVIRSDYKACATAGACTPAQAMDYGIKQPMTGVTWDQAVAFCTWKNKRLPTEAEWEKAARGSDQRPYPWGDAPPDCAHTTMRDDTATCGGDVTEVGTHPTGASPYGAQDMAGNAEEWVSDFFDAAYYASSPTTDPKGPTTGASHVARGGSAVTAASYFRIWIRGGGSATQISGFRCAQSM